MTFPAQKKNPDQLLERERLILDATEAIAELMNQQKVSRAELARRLGKSRGYVTQLLDGRRNMTLKTLADVGIALETGFKVVARPMGPIKPSAAMFDARPTPFRLREFDRRARTPKCWASFNATEQPARAPARLDHDEGADPTAVSFGG